MQGNKQTRELMAKLAYQWEGGGAGRTFPDWLVHIGLKNGSSPAKSRPPSIMQLQYPCLHNNWATHWRLHYSWRIPPVAPRLYYICPIGRLAGAARRGLFKKNPQHLEARRRSVFLLAKTQAYLLVSTFTQTGNFIQRRGSASPRQDSNIRPWSQSAKGKAD